MKSESHKKLATVAAFFLLLFAVKILTPLVIQKSIVTNEVFEYTESDNKESAEKSGNGTQGENLDCNTIYLHSIDFLCLGNNVAPISCCVTNYKSSNYLKVTTPPPDCHLSSAV